MKTAELTELKFSLNNEKMNNLTRICDDIKKKRKLAEYSITDLYYELTDFLVSNEEEIVSRLSSGNVFV